MPEKKTTKNNPILRDDEDKKLYQKIYRKGTVKFRISPEEASLIEAMMIEEEYANMSEFFRVKIFGDNPSRELKQRIQRRSKWDILIAVKNYLKKLNESYRYVCQVMPKDIAGAVGNQNVKQLVELNRKWLAKLQEDTEETNNCLLGIMSALGIDTEGPMANAGEDLWDDPDELKKARLIWELHDSQES